MSRYLLLFLLILPFIIAALISLLTRYKLGKISKKQFTLQSLLWLVVGIGIGFSEVIYTWLFTQQLTQTEPLSLFDVVQIVAIVMLLYVITRMYNRLDSTEKRMRDLHTELSIRLASSSEKEDEKR